MKPGSLRLYPYSFDEMYEDEGGEPLDCSAYMARTAERLSDDPEDDLEP